MKTELNTTWIAGNYPEINTEINTSFGYVAINDYYWQGEEADEVMEKILQIWDNEGNISVEEAINIFKSYYL